MLSQQHQKESQIENEVDMDIYIYREVKDSGPFSVDYGVQIQVVQHVKFTALTPITKYESNGRQ